MAVEPSTAPPFQAGTVDEPVAAGGGLVRVRATVAYHGGRFHGFAPNPGVRTVGGVLADALTRVLRSPEPAAITAAGRTDAGVHGWGQVISFDVPAAVDPVRLRRSVNGLVGPDVVLREVEVASAGFDARFSARWRRYRYHLWCGEVPDPFLADRAWHVPAPIDLPSLRLASEPLIGEHDFASFCRAARGRSGEVLSTRRRVLAADWSSPRPQVLRFEITATAFCHQMVRSLVGTLVAMGTHKLAPGDMLAILRARDRAVAGAVAPPHGLCLWDVGY